MKAIRADMEFVTIVVTDENENNTYMQREDGTWLQHVKLSWEEYGYPEDLDRILLDWVRVHGTPGD